MHLIGALCCLNLCHKSCFFICVDGVQSCGRSSRSFFCSVPNRYSAQTAGHIAYIIYEIQECSLHMFYFRKERASFIYRGSVPTHLQSTSWRPNLLSRHLDATLPPTETETFTSSISVSPHLFKHLQTRHELRL